MADNVSITEGSGTIIGTDEVIDPTLGTVQIQYVKLMDGTLNSTNKLTINSLGQMAISGAVTVNNLPPVQPVSGFLTGITEGVSVNNLKFDSNGYLITNVAVLNASISGGNAAASPTGSTVPAQADYIGIDVGGNLVGISASNPLPVSIASMPTTPVTGTFWQTTQPVSGNVFIDNFPTSTTVNGNIAGITDPVAVTGTFWQSVQPISGNVGLIGNIVVGNVLVGDIAVTNFPAVQEVSGNLYINNFPTSTSITGNITGITTPIVISNFPATQPVSGAVSISGNITGITDGVSVTNFPVTQPVSGAVSISGNITGITDGVSVNNFPATQPVSIASMPTTPVTGTFWQATQPVSIASMPTTPVTGTFWQATQPVSGAVSISGNITGITDGVSVNNFPVTQPVSGAVSISGNITGITDGVSVNNFPVTQPVSGAVSISGNIAGITTPIAISNFPTNSGNVSIDNFPATQQVSGNITSITNTVNTLEVPPSIVLNGIVTVVTSGISIQLPSNTVKAAVIKALSTNSGTIFVGNSSVSSANGFPLGPGDTLSLDINNTNAVWLDSSTNGQIANWIGNY